MTSVIPTALLIFLIACSCIQAICCHIQSFICFLTEHMAYVIADNLIDFRMLNDGEQPGTTSNSKREKVRRSAVAGGYCF